MRKFKDVRATNNSSNRGISPKLASRKFWITVVGSIIDLIASFGFNVIPAEQGILIVTVLWGIYIVVEGMIDLKK